MKHPMFVVDAFVAPGMLGNPAAVCLLAKPIGERRMQEIAAEMNLSETAFAWPIPQGGYRLKWFTPKVEVKLCGHATLATAHVLFETGRVKSGTTITFTTLSGVLTARMSEGKVLLDFPSRNPVAAPRNASLLAALGVADANVFSCDEDALVELSSESAVRSVRPDFGKLSALAVRGVIVTSRAEGERSADFVSRFFAPAVGIDEDPVTGSAHCGLAVLWSLRLKKTAMVGHQLSERGGSVGVRWDGETVRLSGRAKTFLAGELV